MGWLKDRPVLQLLLQGLITLIGLMFMYYLARGDTRDDNEAQKVKQDIIMLKSEKATYDYVDGKYRDHFNYDLIQDKKIENKADKSLVESIDKKLDLILMSLNRGNKNE